MLARMGGNRKGCVWCGVCVYGGGYIPWWGVVKDRWLHFACFPFHFPTIAPTSLSWLILPLIPSLPLRLMNPEWDLVTCSLVSTLPHRWTLLGTSVCNRYVFESERKFTAQHWLWKKKAQSHPVQFHEQHVKPPAHFSWSLFSKIYPSAPWRTVNIHMAMCSGWQSQEGSSCAGLTKPKIKWREAEDGAGVKLTDWICFHERWGRRVGRLMQAGTTLPITPLSLLTSASRSSSSAGLFLPTHMQVKSMNSGLLMIFLPFSGLRLRILLELSIGVFPKETELHVPLKQGWRSWLHPNYHLESCYCHRHASPHGCHHLRCDRKPF